MNQCVELRILAYQAKTKLYVFSWRNKKLLNIFHEDLEPCADRCKGALPWLDRGRKPRPPEASLKPRFD
ncbi:hypothetical protein SynTAK9802_01090 [Synechococcus sp. TAK9802]|nr:hypothetical protein SynTAK9802_01090 [Synechococcus sp. TAK9802]